MKAKIVRYCSIGFALLLPNPHGKGSYVAATSMSMQFTEKLAELGIDKGDVDVDFNINIDENGDVIKGM